jgi:hypothetical protein
LVKESQLSVDRFTAGMTKLLLDILKDGNRVTADHMKLYEDIIAVFEAPLSKQAYEQVQNSEGRISAQEWYHIFCNRTKLMAKNIPRRLTETTEKKFFEDSVRSTGIRMIFQELSRTIQILQKAVVATGTPIT